MTKWSTTESGKRFQYLTTQHAKLFLLRWRSLSDNLLSPGLEQLSCLEVNSVVYYLRSQDQTVSQGFELPFIVKASSVLLLMRIVQGVSRGTFSSKIIKYDEKAERFGFMITNDAVEWRIDKERWSYKTSAIGHYNYIWVNLTVNAGKFSSV